MSALSVLTLATACSGGQPSDPAPSSSEPTPSADAGASATTPSSPAASATPGAGDLGWRPPTVAPIPSGAVPAPESGEAASIVRVQVNNCTGLTQGSAFFITPDLLVTSADLFDQAASIALHSSTGVVRGELMGLDEARGVALVRALPTRDGGKLTGPALTLAGADPSKGEAVTTLAHPIGHELHRARGTVSSVAEGRFEHDAIAAPGTSGGPVLDGQNRVLGLTQPSEPTASTVTAVSASTVADLVKTWRDAPKAHKLTECQQDGPPSMTSIHPDAPAIKASLHRYVMGLHGADRKDATGQTGAQVAWQKLGPALQKQHGSPEKFVASFKGARPTAANVDNLEIRDHFTDTLIWTIQFEGPGSKCVVHKQKLTLSTKPGHWVIDDVTDMEAPRPC